MLLTAYKIGGQPVGTVVTSWTLTELSGNSAFKIESSVSSGYQDISSITNWDSFGEAAGGLCLQIRTEINSLFLLTTFSALSSTEKGIVAKHFLTTKTERDSVRTLIEQQNDAIELAHCIERSSHEYFITDVINGDANTATTVINNESEGNANSGDVNGPANATDNAIARYDSTTGKLIQDSGVIVDDSNNVTTPGAIRAKDGSVSSPGLSFKDHTQTGWFIEASGDMASSVNGQEILEIQTDGRVIISTLLPNYETLVTADNVIPNKKYVDDAVSVASFDVLDFKASVRAGTTANITLSGTQTIDGVLLVVGNRVLVKNQTTAANNGIYVVASGTWSRSTDANTSAEVTGGMYTFIEEGTTQADQGWVLSSNQPITLGTTSLTFIKFTAGIVNTGDIVDDAITNPKLANMATQTFKGRTTAGTGDPEDLSIAQAKTMLSLTGTNSGDDTTTTHGALINGATSKTTPVDADYIGLMDSAASNVLKKLSWTNLKATLKTYFDTLYQVILVSGTSIKTINGSSVLGSGDLTISGGTFGSQYTYAESLAENSTTSTSFQQKLSLSTASLPAGDYRIEWYYEWSGSSTSVDFKTQIQIDNTTNIHDMRIAPENTYAANTYHTASGFAKVTLTAATHTVDIDYCNSAAATAYIRKARLDIFRIS